MLISFLHLQAQERLVTGQVVDAQTRETIPGVNIILKNTSQGIVSDFDGNFKLRVNSWQDTLVFSYIGYQSISIPLQGRSELKVQLPQDIKELQEIVVVGYGTQEKEDLTGAITVIDNEEMVKVPSPNLEQAFQGKIPGVHVTANTGAPGGGMSVQIRGAGTIGNGGATANEPLYVVDGLPLNIGTTLNDLNPEDIENITVLKDASAAAIYGSRGANGVVIITTRKGTAGSLQLDFNGYYGIQQSISQLDMLSGPQFAELSNEMRENANKTKLANFKFPELVETTDWQNQVFRLAPTHRYQLSLSGGSQKSTFLISAGYLDQDGILKGSEFKRYQLRANTSHKLINNKLNIGNTLNLSFIDERPVPVNSWFGSNVVTDAIQQWPNIKPFKSNGQLEDNPGNNISNPLATANLSEIDRYNLNLLGNIFAEYEIIDGLKYKTQAGADLEYLNHKSWTPIFGPSDQLSSTNVYQHYQFLWTFDNTLTYQKNFGAHSMSIMGGVTAQKYLLQSARVNSEGQPFEALKELNTALIIENVGGIKNEWSLFSYLTRFTYDYNNKYLLTANFRADASSRFGPNNRWGYFPSASLGWRISEEDFFNISFIDELKLRASYGTLGNQEIGLYTWAANLQPNADYSSGNDRNQNRLSGLAPNRPPNPDLKWETTTMTDVGIDLEIMEGKLLFTADYYHNITSDMIMERPISYVSGFLEDPVVNAGKMLNTGIEAAVSYRNRLNDNLGFNLDFNISRNYNEVLDLEKDVLGGRVEGGVYLKRASIGQPLGYFYGYKVDRLFQNQDFTESNGKQVLRSDLPLQKGAQPGDIKFRDVSGPAGTPNGVIDDFDRAIIGNPFPDFIYGLNIGFDYKNFQLSTFFQGVQGNDIYNYNKRYYLSLSDELNHTTESLGRWTEQQTNTDIPRAVLGDPNNNLRASDRFLEDGSYLRLRNITLAYSFPLPGFQKFQVYLTGQNVFTLSGYSGFDPEIGTYRDDTDANLGSEQQGTMYSGIDDGNYPLARTYLMGFKFQF